MAVCLTAALVCLSWDEGRRDVYLLHLLSVKKLGLFHLLHLRTVLLIHSDIRTLTSLTDVKLLTVEYKSGVVCAGHFGGLRGVCGVVCGGFLCESYGGH